MDFRDKVENCLKGIDELEYIEQAINKMVPDTTAYMLKHDYNKLCEHYVKLQMAYTEYLTIVDQLKGEEIPPSSCLPKELFQELMVQHSSLEEGFENFLRDVDHKPERARFLIDIVCKVYMSSIQSYREDIFSELPKPE